MTKIRIHLFLLLLLLCGFAGTIYAQESIIKGTVRSQSDGETLIGVSVIVKETKSGTITDTNGKFALKANQKATLVFSYIGFVSKEIVVKGNAPLDIQLSEEAKKLDEVVVVGYGVQKKVNLTGAVEAISGKDIVSRSTTDALTALQGQMPGVTVLRSSGRPGNESSGLRIRGFSSANDASALVLIDGVEGDLKLLNPDDIETISVLKDAAAASIYGARAAAGVMLVTTKKGKAGKLAVTYNGSFGVNMPGNMPKRMSSWDEQVILNVAQVNSGGTDEFNPERMQWIGNGNFNYLPNGARWDQFNASTNWLNEGTKDYTTQQNHSVTVSGGHGATKYYISGGYYTKNGLLKYGPDDYSRTNLRSSLSTELSKHLDFNLITSYEESVTNENPVGATTILQALYTARQRQAIYLPTEDTYYTVSPYSSDLQMNAIQAEREGGISQARWKAFTGNANLHFKDLVKGLTIDLNASRKSGFWSQEVDKPYRKGNARNGAERAYPINNPNGVSKTKNNDYQDKLEVLVNYDLKHLQNTFHVLAGASYEQYNKDQIGVSANNLLSNDFYSLNYYAKDLATNTSVSDAVQPWKMASTFGRVNYDYAGRYLLEGTLRYDGSSRLAPGKRWGLFPSVSGGWRVSEEPFFKVPVVSNLKLRTSWGQLGNSTALNSMYYPYIGTINSDQIMGNPSYYQANMVSDDITWETVTSTNVGIDLGLFKNRLTFSGDYYWKTNDDMLARVRVGNIVGFAAGNLAYQNVGILKTWGWELSLQWRDKIGKVAYNIGFNVDDSQNRLDKYTGNQVIGEGANRLIEGYAMNTIWGYKTDGFWSSRQEYLDYKTANPGYQSWNDGMVAGGDTKYVSQGAKADHTLGVGKGTPADHGDLVYLGNSNGRYMFGVNLGVQWHGFDFSALFQGVGQRTFMVDASTMAINANSYQMPWTIQSDYWTPANTDAYFARPYKGNNFNYHTADRWVQNGAYIRLKNIQLGYNIPMGNNPVIKSVRAYVSGSDVWESSKALSVFDPEVGNNQSPTYYPFFRTWMFGLNVTF